MADILSQDEVDLLLSAVSEGELPPETEESTAAEPTQLSTYDFRRPERVSKEQLKGLQSLFDAFARELSITLPPFLRAVVRVDLASIDQLTYDEFVLSIARPTSLSIIDMAPMDGNAVIELSPSVIFPIVDRVLGGSGQPMGQTRELTEIEMRIVHRIMLMILDCLKRSWDQLVNFNMSVVNHESDPLIVQIVAGSEMVILVGYEVHIGESVGSMTVCIPLMVLNPILDQISEQAHFTKKMSPELAAEIRKILVQNLSRTSVSIEAILGKAKLSINDLARLQVGDVVTLNAAVREPVVLEIGGHPCFKAKPGRRGEHSSVQITTALRGE